MTVPEVDAAIPDRGYLRQYVDYASEKTMAPPEFHLACGLAQMAVLLGNRVVFRLGGHYYPASLWLVLLASAGAKKSTAISLASRLLDGATEGRHRLPQESSREALLGLLSSRPSGYMTLSEFLGFLERSKLEYMSGIREDLCELFDSPERMERRLRGGSTVIRHPAVTIVGGAVTGVLAEWVRSRDLAGGFLSRFLFVPKVSPVQYVGLDEKRFDAREDDLVAGLRECLKAIPIKPNPEVVVLGPEARGVWEGYDRPMTERDVPVEFSGFASRLGLYALKLSLCYAIAERRLVPDESDVWNAVTFTDYARQQTEALVSDVFATGKEGAELTRIRGLMRQMANGQPDGWIDRSDVLKRARVSSATFDRYMGTLEQTHEVETRVVKPEGAGRPKKSLRLVPPGPRP